METPKPAPKPTLGDDGLPVGYRFNADWEITPREVKKLQDARADFLLLDCRLPREWEITRIAGAELIPLQQIQAMFESKLAGREQEQIVVHCHHGGRSLQFAQILRQNGFKKVRSMAGGIHVWNIDVSPGGVLY